MPPSPSLSLSLFPMNQMFSSIFIYYRMHLCQICYKLMIYKCASVKTQQSIKHKTSLTHSTKTNHQHCQNKSWLTHQLHEVKLKAIRDLTLMQWLNEHTRKIIPLTNCSSLFVIVKHARARCYSCYTMCAMLNMSLKASLLALISLRVIASLFAVVWGIVLDFWIHTWQNKSHARTENRLASLRCTISFKSTQPMKHEAPNWTLDVTGGCNTIRFNSQQTNRLNRSMETAAPCQVKQQQTTRISSNFKLLFRPSETLFHSSSVSSALRCIAKYMLRSQRKHKALKVFKSSLTHMYCRWIILPTHPKREGVYVYWRQGQGRDVDHTARRSLEQRARGNRIFTCIRQLLPLPSVSLDWPTTCLTCWCNISSLAGCFTATDSDIGDQNVAAGDRAQVKTAVVLCILLVGPCLITLSEMAVCLI